MVDGKKKGTPFLPLLLCSTKWNTNTFSSLECWTYQISQRSLLFQSLSDLFLFLEITNLLKFRWCHGDGNNVGWNHGVTAIVSNCQLSMCPSSPAPPKKKYIYCIKNPFFFFLNYKKIALFRKLQAVAVKRSCQKLHDCNSHLRPLFIHTRQIRQQCNKQMRSNFMNIKYLQVLGKHFPH